MKNRNDSLLLNIAIADAYAAGCEYTYATQRKALEFAEYFPHPKFDNLGKYTDDTEMSIGTARVLIDHGNQKPTREAFAEAWVEEFNRGGRRKGYSGRLQALFESVTNGREFLEQINPTGTRNGAAMRSVPIGVLPTVAQVLEIASLQTAITHNTAEGLFSSRAVALMSHFALWEKRSFSELPEYCLEHLPAEDKRFQYVFFERWTHGGVEEFDTTSLAVATVHAVVHLLLNTRSFLEIMTQIIIWGGDTDTVAAISWGIASTRFWDTNIPEFLERDLEGGSAETGAAYLKQLGKKLMDKFA